MIPRQLRCRPLGRVVGGEGDFQPPPVNEKVTSLLFKRGKSLPPSSFITCLKGYLKTELAPSNTNESPKIGIKNFNKIQFI